MNDVTSCTEPASQPAAMILRLPFSFYGQAVLSQILLQQFLSVAVIHRVVTHSVMTATVLYGRNPIPQTTDRDRKRRLMSVRVCWAVCAAVTL